MSDSPDVPDVRAIVLNWKDEVRTATCVSALLRDSAIERVIVVDNESRGKQVSVLEKSLRHRVTVLESRENRGFAAGVNLALRSDEARDAEYLLFINNDAIVQQDAISQLVAFLEDHPDIDMVSPLILNPDGSVQAAGVTVHPWTARAIEIRSAGIDPDYLTWACVLVRSTLFEEIGPLNERFFMYWEDLEFSLRCVRAGGRLAVCWDSRVVHELSASRGQAGDRLRLYYAMGLVRLGGLLGASWRVGSCIRVLQIIARRVTKRDWRGLRAVAAGLGMGLSREKTAYLQIMKRAK